MKLGMTGIADSCLAVAMQQPVAEVTGAGEVGIDTQREVLVLARQVCLSRLHQSLRLIVIGNGFG